MRRYDLEVVNEAKRLRSTGHTYSEIRKDLDLIVPKGTLHSWFKEIVLPKSYYLKLKKMNNTHLDKARLIAFEKNRIKRQEFLDSLDEVNKEVSESIHNYQAAKIALAMLCLGEASKYGTGSSFYLGSSDPKIIIIF